MTPATGATGKPMSYLFTPAVKKARTVKQGTDCPHATKTYKAGAWRCKRCGEPVT